MKGRSRRRSKRMRRSLASVNVTDPSKFYSFRGPSSKKQRLITGTATGTTSYTPKILPTPPLVLSPEVSISSEEESEGNADSVDEEEDSDVPNESDGYAATETESGEEQTPDQLEDDSQSSTGQQAVVTETLSNARNPTTLTLPDPDLLDCPVCFEILRIPIYQCKNGHIACNLCCLIMKNKCPSCPSPIGYYRCRAVENILEAVEVSCGNAKYGCDHMMKYCGSYEHESSCVYAPCFCPIDDCIFDGSSWNFYKHFHANHSSMTFSFNCPFSVFLDSSNTRLFLREDTIDAVFVLTNSPVNDTRVLSVVLIAPKSHMKKYRFELEAKDEETSLTLKSSVESVPKLADDHKPTKYLVVNFNNQPQAKLELVICIRQHVC